eukprot:Opistho-1_new@8335
MMHSNHSGNIFNRRFCDLQFLLFLWVQLVMGCNTHQQESVFTFTNGKPSGLLIPAELVKGIPADSFTQYVTVKRADQPATAILGSFHLEQNLLFEPLIPFSFDTEYLLYIRGKKISTISSKDPNPGVAPMVVATYPQLDTVPDNLLKIYLQFSQPMREGQSLQHISLLVNGKDSLRDVFLDLQPELWNEDRTVVTLWLDPGRIKRDLQPHLRMGNPLQQQTRYTLVVSANWQNTKGIPLGQPYRWQFSTTIRDSLSPVPANWKIAVPVRETQNSLSIYFGEVLDHFLLQESFTIKNGNGDTVTGHWEISDKDRACRFIPSAPWAAGNYTIQIAARLEDLAGNNLNRPFDRDLRDPKKPATQNHYQRTFHIR